MKTIESATPRRTRHESRLGVAYNTASDQRVVLELRVEPPRRRTANWYLEDIRRFKLDDAVAIVINDPDMDQSPERDQVEFSVTAVGRALLPVSANQTGRSARPTEGESVKLVALETEPHSGVSSWVASFRSHPPRPAIPKSRSPQAAR